MTALGVVTDAALLSQQIVGAYDGHGYWLVRRSRALFDETIWFVPDKRLAPYRASRSQTLRRDEQPFEEVRARLTDHGFHLLPPLCVTLR